MELNSILLQGAGAGAGGMMNILMIVALIAIFYFFMIRPQSKKQKEIRKFRESLTKGDRVVTAGGIYGILKEVNDTYVILEIADNVRIKIDKGSIYKSSSDAAESNANNNTASK